MFRVRVRVRVRVIVRVRVRVRVWVSVRIRVMVGVHGLALGLVWCLYRPMVRVLAVSLELGSEVGLG